MACPFLGVIVGVQDRNTSHSYRNCTEIYVGVVTFVQKLYFLGRYQSWRSSPRSGVSFFRRISRRRYVTIVQKLMSAWSAEIGECTFLSFILYGMYDLETAVCN